MKKASIIIVSFIVFLLVISLTLSFFDKNSDADSMMEKDYSGNIIAGKKSLYLTFNQKDYEKALMENKTILLYFYAAWCPTCNAEQPAISKAFDKLDDENTIGFRVNYKDDDTDNDEIDLAKKFGISYQHTKVLIKNGEQVTKSLESWDEEEYLETLADK